jgi:SAM-dependent methyltransferase
LGQKAALVAELQDRRAAETLEQLRRLLTLTGEERALEVGAGAGALAIALARFVREVVGVDTVPELLGEGRKRAPANVELVEADASALPFERGSFDLVCTARTLHHVPRPELVLAEMNRVLRPGGTMARDRSARAGRLARGDRAEPLRAGPRSIDDAHTRRRRPAWALRGERLRPQAAALFPELRGRRGAAGPSASGYCSIGAGSGTS